VRVSLLSFPLGFSLFALLCGAAWGVEPVQTFTVPAEEQGGWVRVSPGARPAYVGIHGGTAPVSLRIAPDGSVIAVTGHSGNDFTQILHNRPPDGAALPDFSTGASVQAALLPVGLDLSATAPLAPEGRPEIKTAGRAFKPLKLGSYKRVLRKPGNV